MAKKKKSGAARRKKKAAQAAAATVISSSTPLADDAAVTITPPPEDEGTEKNAVGEEDKEEEKKEAPPSPPTATPEKGSNVKEEEEGETQRASGVFAVDEASSPSNLKQPTLRRMEKAEEDEDALSVETDRTSNAAPSGAASAYGGGGGGGGGLFPSFFPGVSPMTTDVSETLSRSSSESGMYQRTASELATFADVGALPPAKEEGEKEVEDSSKLLTEEEVQEAETLEDLLMETKGDGDAGGTDPSLEKSKTLTEACAQWMSREASMVTLQSAEASAAVAASASAAQEETANALPAVSMTNATSLAAMSSVSVTPPSSTDDLTNNDRARYTSDGTASSAVVAPPLVTEAVSSPEAGVAVPETPLISNKASLGGSPISPLGQSDLSKLELPAAATLIADVGDSIAGMGKARGEGVVLVVPASTRSAPIARGAPPLVADAGPKLPPVSPKPPLPSTRVTLGICAMDKKARSKPMAEILSRLDESLFEVVFFGDKVILGSPVEDWPIVDVLIAFYSHGYPLEKAEEYADLRKPFVLNDLRMQRTLMDRRRVYDLLEESGIDVPRHVYMSRDGYVSKGTGAGDGHNDNDLVEYDDHIELNGVVVHKPFVEKPVDADDHNIAIYYPSSAGGGCKKLFRKIGDRSSEFYPDINEVRRDGSYIYEEFVETQGTDVKMYTVGPDYGHAEARKSPTVDGKVERNSDGKEVRFPVILTLREKEIARRIVLGFKQQVCGFDLLRVQEGDSLVSYVCDVNGWSFVKNSRKYYDDCAQILTEHMLAAVKPMALQCFSTLVPLMTTVEDLDVNQPDTPKKKRKKVHERKTSMLQRASRLLQGDLLNDNKIVQVDGVPTETPDRVQDEEVSAESPYPPSNTAATTLQEGAIPVREIPDKLATEPASICTSAASSVVGDDEVASRGSIETGSRGQSVAATHQEELRCVIAIIRHGDRTPKQKLKVNMTEPELLQYFHDHTDNCKKDLKVKAKTPMIEFLETVKVMISDKERDGGMKKHGEILYKLRHMRDVLQRWKIGGLNRKLQLKPRKWEEVEDEDGRPVLRCTELQLILKWGGNLTKLGERQSINLGERLRHEMYPDAPGGGILRLHSTFRHDLKIKTSDEGRVMKTGAAFAKGMLELEGEIPPILVSLVHKEKSSLHMLDPSGNKEVKKELEKCKEKINENLQKDFEFDQTSVVDHENIVGPVQLTSLHRALRQVGNPRKTLFAIHKTIGELVEQLEDMLGLLSGDEDVIEGGEGLISKSEGDEALCGIKLYKGETLLELTERWKLLHNRLYDEEKDVFDLSRVPDVHDNVRFDMLHNPHLGLTSTLEKLYTLAKLMADVVVPQEYGTSLEEKRSIGNKMCRTLLEKIKYDLIIARTDNQVDMRYMINTDYSADLPINTMGRRIRTRLYFTSESHLHTLLNVMRFAAGDRSSLLSRKGKDILSEASELCYLTQVVIRLFEDTKKTMDDPRRFRIEILFSPGATATPLHMSEIDRDLESTRFDTAPLKIISRDGLTCHEVEDYFDLSIKDGKTVEDDDDCDTVASTIDGKRREKIKNKVKKSKPIKKMVSEVRKVPSVAKIAENVDGEMASHAAEENGTHSLSSSVDPAEVNPENASAPNAETLLEKKDRAGGCTDESEMKREDEARSIPVGDKNGEQAERMRTIQFWRSVTAASVVIGVGFLLMSRRTRR